MSRVRLGWLVRGSCVAHTVRGSCVAHIHPSCWVPVSCPVGWVGAWLMCGWVPVSVPQDKSPRSQELNRQVPSRRFIKRCPMPHDRDTAYRLYSVDGKSVQTLALHPTFWNVNTVLKMVGAWLMRGPHRAWLMRGSHPS
jgi:hypothetical protein